MPKARPKTQPPGDCPFPYTLEGGSQFPSGLKQRETKALSSPAAPPSLPGSSPMPTAHSWQLVLEPRTQASLLSGSTDPGREGWRRDAKAPLQRPPRRQDQPTHTSPEPALCLPRRAPFPLPGAHLRLAPEAGGLRCALTRPRPHPRPMEPQRHDPRKGQGQLESPRAARCHRRTSHLALCTPAQLPHPPAPRESPGWGADRHRVNPSSMLRYLLGTSFSFTGLLGTEAADLC